MAKTVDEVTAWLMAHQGVVATFPPGADWLEDDVRELATTLLQFLEESA